MKFKEGVLLRKGTTQMQAVIVGAMSTVDFIYSNFNKELVITSVVDGKHSKNSLHYKGLAFDCRISYFTEEEKKDVRDCIAIALGDDFDVVLEVTHIHIEYDPR